MIINVYGIFVTCLPIIAFDFAGIGLAASQRNSRVNVIVASLFQQQGFFIAVPFEIIPHFGIVAYPVARYVPQNMHLFIQIRFCFQCEMRKEIIPVGVRIIRALQVYYIASVQVFVRTVNMFFPARDIRVQGGMVIRFVIFDAFDFPVENPFRGYVERLVLVACLENQCRIHFVIDAVVLVKTRRCQNSLVVAAAVLLDYDS